MQTLSKLVILCILLISDINTNAQFKEFIAIKEFLIYLTWIFFLEFNILIDV